MPQVILNNMYYTWYFLFSKSYQQGDIRNLCHNALWDVRQLRPFYSNLCHRAKRLLKPGMIEWKYTAISVFWFWYSLTLWVRGKKKPKQPTFDSLIVVHQILGLNWFAQIKKDYTLGDISKFKITT